SSKAIHRCDRLGGFPFHPLSIQGSRMSAFNAFRQRYLVRFWSPLPALVALGVASAYYFAPSG
ncbi:hypothetical protein, partial [Escherichia coli]|uniref:hypothetical protein n=1 Tax=Escherichia coli TaxID=562 RepID=UPI001BD38AA7